MFETLLEILYVKNNSSIADLPGPSRLACKTGSILNVTCAIFTVVGTTDVMVNYILKGIHININTILHRIYFSVLCNKLRVKTQVTFKNISTFYIYCLGFF